MRVCKDACRKAYFNKEMLRELGIRFFELIFFFGFKRALGFKLMGVYEYTYTYPPVLFREGIAKLAF